MAVVITGTGPTVLRTFTFPDANAKILTNAQAVLVSEGGTGITAFAPHAVVIGNGTGGMSATSAGTAGQPLRSGGASADPSFGEVVQTTTLTGTQNDLVLNAGASVLRCNNASLLTITGLTEGFDGQRLIIRSVGAGQVDLSHQAGASTSTRRLVNYATSAATSLAAGIGTAEYEYDVTSARWSLVGHEQGAWIAWTPVLGGTGGTSGQTYTTQSGAYILRGRTVIANGYVLLSAKGTITTFAQIQGLPFLAALAPSFNAASIGQMNNLATTWVSVAGYVQASTSTIALIGRTVASATVVNIAGTDIGNTTDCMVSVSYPVA